LYFLGKSSKNKGFYICVEKSSPKCNAPHSPSLGEKKTSLKRIPFSPFSPREEKTSPGKILLPPDSLLPLPKGRRIIL